MSDTEIPPLDIGWPSNGHYKGITRVSVYSHPPKSNSPHIKEVVRRLIQDSTKVSDLNQECSSLPHFLDMSSRLQISAQHLRNLRVRTVRGSGMPLSFGRLPGSLCSKYMLVDGEKVMFGSYSFTWSSSRMNRNTITVMSGQVVDFFDNDFRELYAVSDKVDLYREFHISKPALPVPVLKTPAETNRLTVPVSTSRFQISVGDSRQGDLKVPAHKYHNPKYSLVVGNSLGVTGSLQDLSNVRPQSPTSPDGTEDNKGDGKKLLQFGSKKQRSSFRHFLKGRANNQKRVLIHIYSKKKKKKEEIFLIMFSLEKTWIVILPTIILIQLSAEKLNVGAVILNGSAADTARRWCQKKNK
uniref:Family with sequence similarity 83 member Fa n=1 Tax=Cyprinus carpio TaxID=7962 RepID=A0A8C2EUC6_CYPCA